MTREYTIGSVVEYILEDKRLLQNVEQFKDALEMPVAAWLQAETLFKMKNSYYALFSTILEEWVGRMGAGAKVQTLVRLLRGMDCRNAAGLIDQHLSTNGIFVFARSSPLTDCCGGLIQYGIGHRLRTFVGRDKERSELKEIYHSYMEGMKDMGSAFVCIHGIAGVGKSQLLRTFIYDCGVLSSANVTCFSARDEAEILAGLRSFLKGNYTYDESDDESDEIKKLLTVIEKRGQPWILVLENLDEEYQFLTGFLGKLFLLPGILLITTSRRKNVLGEAHDVNRIEVNNFQEGEAAIYLQTCFKGLTLAADDMIGLQKALKNFPLALSQASANIRGRTIANRFYSIRDYLTEFQENSGRLLNTHTETDPYKLSTLTAIDLTIRHIREMNTAEAKTALSLFEVACFLPPEEIEIPLLYALEKSEGYTKMVYLAGNPLDLLSIYCIADYVSRTAVSVHSLAQIVMRILLLKEEKRVRSNGYHSSFWNIPARCITLKAGESAVGNPVVSTHQAISAFWIGTQSRFFHEMPDFEGQYLILANAALKDGLKKDMYQLSVKIYNSFLGRRGVGPYLDVSQFIRRWQIVTLIESGKLDLAQALATETFQTECKNPTFPNPQAQLALLFWCYILQNKGENNDSLAILQKIKPEWRGKKLRALGEWLTLTANARKTDANVLHADILRLEEAIVFQSSFNTCENVKALEVYRASETRSFLVCQSKREDGAASDMDYHRVKKALMFCSLDSFWTE